MPTIAQGSDEMESKIDWSKAPEGASHFCSGDWFKKEDGKWCNWFDGARSWTEAAYADPANFSWWGLRIERPSPDWSGEGLPPVGVDIEVLHELYGWIGARVVGQDGEAAIVRTNDGYAGVFPHQMRPIRTPEQIAADERELEQALREACEIVGCAPGSMYGIEVVKKMIEAGYRKP